MDGGVENCDVSGGDCFMKIHTISESKNLSYIYYTNKRDGNVPNVSEMKDTGLQDGVDIDAMFYACKINQYFNMECNNESHYPSISCKIPPSKNS